MLHPDIRVKYSPIEGKGLFAKKKIPRGTVVWKIGEGDRIYDIAQVRKFSKRFRNVLDRYAYLSTDGKTLVYVTDDSKYFNHSCNPNTVPLFETGIEMDIAIRDILPGEELSYDYGFLCDEGERMPCNCAARECRKIIRRFPKNSVTAKRLQASGKRAGIEGLKIKQPLVGRRDPCPCGSGKESEKCHGK